MVGVDHRAGDGDGDGDGRRRAKVEDGDGEERLCSSRHPHAEMA